MILNLTELRNEFENLKKIRIDIKQYFENLSNKIQQLTGIYSKYIKDQDNAENKGNILFGLDALHFQTFLINFEYDNMKNMHILIENKLYCEYYKLFKFMVQYVKLNINDIQILKVCEHKTKYPVYKDLEQYKIYDFELINQIHDDILLLLELMSKFVIKKEKELELDETNTMNGLNLHIVVNTIDFNISLLKQNLKLYINYLKVFHRYHTTYLSRLNIKIGIMWGQINKDIKIERTCTTELVNDERNYKIIKCPSLTDIQQQELISYLDANNSSVKDELNEIMIHLSDESSNDSPDNLMENENENYDYTIEYLNNESNNQIDINTSNKIEVTQYNMNEVKEYHKDDIPNIGALSSEELKNRWNNKLNEILNDSNNMNVKEKQNHDTEINLMLNININNDESELENSFKIETEQDELNKWREIINNSELTQEEKVKEKAKLKRMRYKQNRKYRTTGSL